MLGKSKWAYFCLHKALQVNPGYAEAYNNLGVLYRDEGCIDEAIRAYSKCLLIDPSARNAAHNRLLAMNSISTNILGSKRVNKSIFEAHRLWGEYFQRLWTKYSHYRNKLERDRILRVGYLSADFFTHSVSYFIESPLQFSNSNRVFTVCYSNSMKNDQKTERLKLLAGQWRQIHGMKTSEVCDLIRDDGIDILVDLAGHTAGNRLDVMAMKPAPILATWIGYPNTSGLPAIDYRLTDSLADPVDTEQLYTEELVRLPGPFLCYTPPCNPPSVSTAPANILSRITFGSFNNLAKVNDNVLDSWAEILTQLPTSRLLLKCKPFACPSIQSKFVQKFLERNIDPSRIDLLPLLQSTTGLDSINYFFVFTR